MTRRSGAMNKVTSLAATPSGSLPLVASVTCGQSAGAPMVGRPGRRWTRSRRPRQYLRLLGNGIAADASGNLYVTGQSELLVNQVRAFHWITRKSTDGGTTWRTVDDFLIGTYPSGRAVTVDTFGRISVTGNYTTASGSTTTNHWLTRASADGGATWSTTDDYIALGGALGCAAASDAAGNVFTSGKARTALGNPTSVVRKLVAP